MPEKHFDASIVSSQCFTLPFAYCRLLHCILFPAIRILFFLPLVMGENRRVIHVYVASTSLKYPQSA